MTKIAVSISGSQSAIGRAEGLQPPSGLDVWSGNADQVAYGSTCEPPDAIHVARERLVERG